MGRKDDLAHAHGAERWQAVISALLAIVSVVRFEDRNPLKKRHEKESESFTS